MMMIYRKKWFLQCGDAALKTNIPVLELCHLLTVNKTELLNFKRIHIYDFFPQIVTWL